jgi:hypothetical protein
MSPEDLAQELPPRFDLPGRLAGDGNDLPVVNPRLQRRMADAKRLGLISNALARKWGKSMKENHEVANDRGWLVSVLTDIHFWVPVMVLIGGLLLLRSIH